MQIHELTRKQLNEVDLAGQGGLWSGIKSAAKAVVQPGGVKDALRTVAPGANQGLGSTAALTTSDFAQRMQAVKNSAAIKQVAANLQKQWMQVSKSLPATTPASTTTTPASTTTTPASTTNLSTSQSRLANKAAAYKATRTESVQLDEAASLDQLTGWYTQSVIPKSMAAASAKYLANPVIKTALNKIIATADNSGEQSKAFVDLVAATSAESQQISAENPQAAATGGAPRATRTLASSADVAKTNISKTAGISPSQIDAIAKIMDGLPAVTSRDPNTIAYLRALGFDVQ
jgi:hypothetical protein